MKKNDKKTLIMIIVIALLVVILFMIMQGLIKVPKLHSKNNSSELGSITMTAEDYDDSQKYEWQYDEIIESEDKVFTNIQNLDLVSDNLTLQAIEDIDSELSDFLMLHGYSGEDVVNLSTQKVKYNNHITRYGQFGNNILIFGWKRYLF